MPLTVKRMANTLSSLAVIQNALITKATAISSINGKCHILKLKAVELV